MHAEKTNPLIEEKMKTIMQKQKKTTLNNRSKKVSIGRFLEIALQSFQLLEYVPRKGMVQLQNYNLNKVKI